MTDLYSNFSFFFRFGSVSVLPLADGISKPILNHQEIQKSVIEAYSKPIQDFDLNPFKVNDLIMTDGSTLRYYALPRDSNKIQGPLKDPSFEISSFSQRITSLQYHPTASNLSFVALRNGQISFIDLNQQQISLSVDAIHHNSMLQCFSWDFDGNSLFTSSKDMKIRLLDPRASSPVSHCIEKTHESIKGLTIKWLSNRDSLISCGFSKSGDREMYLWDIRNLNSPIKKEIVDHNPGMISIHEDPSTGIIFLLGKGDDVIKYYEVREDEGQFHFISKFVCKESHSDVCAFPKTMVDVSICEIVRFARLTKDKVDHVMFQVPRREKKNNEKIYYEDLYTIVESIEPSKDVKQWIQGNNEKRKCLNSSTLKPEGYTSIYEIEVEEDILGRVTQTYMSKTEKRKSDRPVTEAPQGQVDHETNKQVANKMLEMFQKQVESDEENVSVEEYIQDEEEDEEEEEEGTPNIEIPVETKTSNSTLLECNGNQRQYKNGFTYDGESKNHPLRSGKGAFYNELIRFEGNWEEDIRHGEGAIIMSDGKEQIQGIWTKNKLDLSKCTFEVKDSFTYQGEEIRKYGIYTGQIKLPNGDTYEGEFREGKRHGNGKMVYGQQNIIYVGQWRNDSRHGNGEILFPNGTKYQGAWKYDLMDGEGVYTSENGREIEGTWKRGQYIDKRM